MLKSIEELIEKLDNFAISRRRKEDLIYKYRFADKELTKNMNDYFGIYITNNLNKTSNTNKPNRTRTYKTKDINKTTVKRKVIKTYSEKDTSNTKENHGNFAGNFDQRLRTTVEPSYQLDKSLDDEYFKD